MQLAVLFDEEPKEVSVVAVGDGATDRAPVFLQCVQEAQLLEVQRAVLWVSIRRRGD
jgi:spermidine synthase